MLRITVLAGDGVRRNVAGTGGPVAEMDEVKGSNRLVGL